MKTIRNLTCCEDEELQEVEGEKSAGEISRSRRLVKLSRVSHPPRCYRRPEIVQRTEEHYRSFMERR
ncbi:hypothetical protein TIFTF001_026945 [Ficus carica]|uniref:Uncharacterized protein n=1 Tax=Ficus carica TaxID=3494 RepID=A0AA88IUB6_FICCA|nr:hypothetical protein TIFTF001_026945 [Ficus carica]